MTPKVRHIMRQLREEGMTLERIGAAFLVTKEAVRQAIGPRTPPLYLTEEEKAARKRLWNKNAYRRKCGLTPTLKD